MDYSRIEEAVDIKLLKNTHIVVVGAGGSYSLVCSLARTGIGKITVLDYDTVEASNIVRQGYEQLDVGSYKVDALSKAVARINPDTEYNGITKNFHDMSESELDAIFKEADLAMFLTDSFPAQAFGNILALKYMIPAIWAGWYAKSRTAEIFFSIPQYTPACFRCCCSSRYIANDKKEVQVSSNCNTIFHSQLLDSFIGFIALGILHRGQFTRVSGMIGAGVYTTLKYLYNSESSSFFEKGMNGTKNLDFNFLQFKLHPDGGNKLFEKSYKALDKHARIFTPYFQQIEPELKTTGYDYDCPDCKGKLNNFFK